jgi:hypothetical protein
MLKKLNNSMDQLINLWNQDKKQEVKHMELVGDQEIIIMVMELDLLKKLGNKQIMVIMPC